MYSGAMERLNYHHLYYFWEVAKRGADWPLTQVGQLTYRYAEEIFSLGREMQDVLKRRPAGRPVRFRVGVSDVVPN